MGDIQFANYPDLSLSQHVFHITNPHSSERTQQASLTALQNAIKEHKMAPLYRHLAHPVDGILNAPGEGTSATPSIGIRRQSSSANSLLASRRPSVHLTLPWDETLYEELTKENEVELESIQKEEDDAVEKAGETEIQTARGKRAEFWTRIGEKVCALSSTC
jgi:26S proteasome regulatory subunit N7